MPAPARQKNFIFCVHAHQPVGNFGGVFHEAVEKCYSPFLDVLETHPRVPVVLHLSGSLIEWLETGRPDFLERLRSLSRTHEVEFLGGAYYEPIYGLIPRRDLLGQIARMGDKIEALFGRRPEGAWLTERVWNPDLVEVLSQAGIRYTVLDDAHFEKTGINSPVTGYYTANGGPCLTGRQAYAVDLFSSMKTLRYLMPFRDARDAMRHIRSLKTGPERAVVFADDIEKFGMWPGTARWVYGERWLDRFFTMLEEDPEVQPTTFSRFREMYPSVAKVHVPPGSYEEMTQWSGGGFDNFFEKYSESRYMKERMWQVSDRVAEGGAAIALEESKTALYRAQCNCPYWHGVFGGLYLHHLRASVFENLIKADTALAGSAPALPAFRELSFGSGARWELRQERITSFFNPGYGAALEELDFLPKSANLLCTLQRRPEAYHRFVTPGIKGKPGAALSIHQILGVKDKGLEKKLSYDTFRKLSFLDHFFERRIGRDDFELSRYEEMGDFTEGAYEGRLEGPALVFERSGFVRSSGKKVRVHIRKSISAQGPGGLRVGYRITNEGDMALSAAFGVELNFSIGEESLGDGISRSGVREHIFRDSWRGMEIGLRCEPEASMDAAPIATVSESEGGIEGNYQQTAVLFQQDLTLEPGASALHTFELEVN